MKFGRFTTFTLGVIFTAVTIGAVTYVSASNGATITACANKTTGTLRLLSKGSCKKTETKLSWNQQGPQGMPGAKGDTGAKGDAGVATNGINGTNGQNLHAIDAMGKDLGLVIGTDLTGGFDSITVLIDGGRFNLATSEYVAYDAISFFKDSSCVVPVGLYTGDGYDPGITTFPADKRWIMAKAANLRPTAAFKATGNSFTLITVYAWDRILQTCTAKTVSSYFSGQYPYFTDLVQVSLPTYTAPLTIVSR